MSWSKQAHGSERDPPRSSRYNFNDRDSDTTDHTPPPKPVRLSVPHAPVFTGRVASVHKTVSGVQHDSPSPGLDLHRRMRWVKSKGRWHGEWEWIQTKSAKAPHTGADDHSNSSVSCAITFPTEILLMIIEFHAELVADDLREGHYARSVKWLNLLLVSRVWFYHAQTLMFKVVDIKVAKVDQLTSVLRRPNPTASESARSIIIRGRHPWNHGARLTKLLPGASLLRLDSRDAESIDNIPPVYHPTQFNTVCQTFHSSIGIAVLQLKDCRFMQSADLLYLLGSLPRLQHVVLNSVSVAGKARAIARRRSPQLTKVEARNMDGTLRSLLAHLVFSQTLLAGSHKAGCARLVASETDIIIALLDFLAERYARPGLQFLSATEWCTLETPTDEHTCASNFFSRIPWLLTLILRGRSVREVASAGRTLRVPRRISGLPRSAVPRDMGQHSLRSVDPKTSQCRRGRPRESGRVPRSAHVSAKCYTRDQGRHGGRRADALALQERRSS